MDSSTMEVLTVIGVGLTAIATGIATLLKFTLRSKVRYRIVDVSHSRENSQMNGSEAIISKDIEIENRGNRPARSVTVHIRSNVKMKPISQVFSNIKGYKKEDRSDEVYVWIDELRARGGRLVLRIHTLERFLKSSSKPFIADYEISDSRGKAKKVSMMKYIGKSK
ncbi:MAG: hypothetical protein GF388_00145 [Candidatus Aegiribacteria sp.]|nr:hypothetical protein [Candidatus Aegiribacteria sp.]